MTRKQFIERTNNRFFCVRNFAGNSVPSETDPSEALTGYQMFLAAQSGIQLNTKANYKFNGLKVDQLTPVDNPNADFFDKVRYAQSVEEDVRSKHAKMQSDVQAAEHNNNNIKNS